MGLLALGTPMGWFESRKYNEHVKRNGVEQLLSVFAAASGRQGDPLYWGDEIEYMMVEYDNVEHNAMLDVVHDEILTSLNTEDLSLCTAHNVNFHPEYGRFMLEATPHKPYCGYSGDYVEYNMSQRREVARIKYDQLQQQEPEGRTLGLLTLTVFPRMGCDSFVNIPDSRKHKSEASRSQFLPDDVINRHIRFPTLTTNIRTRRGERVCMNVPMYRDINTPTMDDGDYWSLHEDEEAKLARRPHYIYMDAMGFGMGCCCLQTTFQAPNVDMARYLYDSMANLAPIMLAASAAAPMFKGWLADQDVRWNVISGAVDDRTPQERGEKPLLLKSNPHGFGGIDPEHYADVQRLQKSRYSTQDLYLGGNKFFKRSYNDTEVPVNNQVLDRLLDNDVAPMDYDLARHFAHLYVRDPLVIFEESLDQDNARSTNHFENIQSTNWQTLRFKPPTQEAVPSNMESPGWRVEFRTLEVQLTDFENAAYTQLVYLIAESLLTFSDSLNAYVPMSQIWENMSSAHDKDAIMKCKFHWKDSFDPTATTTSLCSLHEIFHSANGIFPTFINPILRHKGFISEDWQELKSSPDHTRLYYYLKLISNRVSGKLPSIAKFLRAFVTQHRDYAGDSKISKPINYDLLKMCDRVTRLDDSRNELTQFFGTELADYLKKQKPSSSLASGCFVQNQ